MKKTILSSLTLLSLVIGVSCADNNHMPIKTRLKGDLLGGATSTKTSSISFTDVLPILQKCTVCHVKGGAIPYWEDFDVTKSKIDRLVDRVFVQRNMPMQPVTLSEDELKLLKKWIDAGAPPAAAAEANPQPEPVPNPEPTPDPNAPVPTPEPTPEPTPMPELPPADGNYTYVKDILPIFTSRCNFCHVEGGGLPNWGDYETAKSKLDRIMDRVVIKRDMPMGMPMEDLERSMIKTWIDNGGIKE